MRPFVLCLFLLAATTLVGCSPSADIDRPANQSYRLTPGDTLPAPYERFVYSGKVGASLVSFTELDDGRPVRTLNLPFRQNKAVPLDGTTTKRLTFSSLSGDTLSVVFRQGVSTQPVE